MEYNSDTTQSEGIQPCDRCERLDWLDENMLCSFCVAWDEEVNEVEAQLDEARALLGAVIKFGKQNRPYKCTICGGLILNTNMHVRGCPEYEIRKWLEAQVQDDPVPDIHTDTDWCECSVCKAEAQDYG